MVSMKIMDCYENSIWPQNVKYFAAMTVFQQKDLRRKYMYMDDGGPSACKLERAQ